MVDTAADELADADVTLAVVCPECGDFRMVQGAPKTSPQTLDSDTATLLDEAAAFGWIPVRIGSRRAVVCGESCARRWVGAGSEFHDGYDDPHRRQPYANAALLRSAVDAMGDEEFRPKDVHDHPALEGFDCSMQRVYSLLRKLAASGELIRTGDPGHQGVRYRRATVPVTVSTTAAPAVQELSGIPGAAGFRVLVTAFPGDQGRVHPFHASILGRETGEVLYSGLFDSAVAARDALREEVPVLCRRMAEAASPGGAR